MYISGSNGSAAGIAVEAKRSREERKEKQVGWFTRWFDRKCRESWERANEGNIPSVYIDSPKQARLDSNGLNLCIYGADGGTVLEFRHYDHKTDRHSNSLHVISQTDNFEERVAQAITMEMLRKGLSN